MKKEEKETGNKNVNIICLMLDWNQHTICKKNTGSLFYRLGCTNNTYFRGLFLVDKIYALNLHSVTDFSF